MESFKNLKKFSSLLVIMILSLVIGITGCNTQKAKEGTAEPKTEKVEVKEESKEEAKEELKKDEGIALSNWVGEWNDLAAYMNKDGYKEIFDKLAAIKAKEANQTPEEYKAEYIKKRKTDFSAMEFSGDKITVYDDFKKDGGKEISSSEYEYIGYETTMRKDKEVHWQVFKAKDENAKYKYFLLLPVHGEEKGLPHYHFKYGNEDTKAIANIENWSPTFIPANFTPEDLEKALIPKEESQVSLSNWVGEWNNIAHYMDKDGYKESFEEMYEDHAKENKTTVEEEKSKYLDMVNAEFGAMEFSGEKITIYDKFKDEGGKEISSSEYKYIGQETTKYGNHDVKWEVFEAKDSGAKYKYFLLTPVHGEDTGMVHFHFRYGNGEIKEMLEKDNWYPTFIVPGMTAQQFHDAMHSDHEH